MPAISPSVRKWLAHLDRGEDITWRDRGLPYAGAEAGRITEMMCCRLVDLGYVEFKGDRAALTDRGRVALVAADVTPGMRRQLRAAAGDGRKVFDAKLYRLGLVDDYLVATGRGLKVLGLLDA